MSKNIHRGDRGASSGPGPGSSKSNSTSKDGYPDFPAEHRIYTRWRHRRRQAAVASERTRSSKEAEDLIRFARTWAPYGGGSDEDILVQFGMTRSRFIDRLLRVLTAEALDPGLAAQLADAYTRPMTRRNEMLSTVEKE